ncbi:MAG: hypothetical protein M1820_007408 [Bogoriella megaspora]|nr:MAG: hypothetical protein M1820_007408 [Bogoriella megaspora]
MCIDQNNLDEESRQAPLMGRIYEGADRVLIWLGDSFDHNPEAVSLIEELSELNVEDASKHRDLYSLLLFGAPLSSRSGTEKQPHDSERDKEAIAAKLHHVGLPPLDMAHWRYIRGFLDQPWFSRVWIVQEVALAKSAVILSGIGTISWTAMGTVGQMMHPLGFPAIVGGRQWGTISSINSLTVAEFQASAPPGGPDLLEDFNHILFFTAHAAATDPRDELYALFGLQERLSGDMPPV